MANYFIMIDDGPDVRRRLLESSKASLQVLKGYQQLTGIRGEKLTLMAELRRELKQVTILINRAEQLLPQFSQAELGDMSPGRAQLPVLDDIRPAQPKPPKQVFIAAPKKKFVKEVPAPPPPPPQKVEQKQVPKMTELERLEAQLAAVEDRLGNL